MKATKTGLGALLIALILSPAQANADWELVVGDAYGRKHFLDFGTIRQQGKYTLIWSKLELSKAGLYDGNKYYSVKMLDVYDCTEFKIGAKSLMYYSGKSGDGEVVFSFTGELYEVEFSDVVPESVNEAKFNRVCAISK